MFDRPSDPTPDATQLALDARVDQISALLRDVFDRLQLNLNDPDIVRAATTVASYFYAVLMGMVENDPHGLRTQAELATHHAAFQRMMEAYT